MEKIRIDSEKCTGCGLCVKDCVGLDIKIENGKATASGNTCILCGHCEAVCPNGAVKVQGYNETVEVFSEQIRLNPEELLKAIKTRRTIRQFTEETVSKEIIDLIIESGRLAPTGTNSQGTSYIIIQEKKSDVEKIAVKMFRKVLGKDKVSASLAAQNMAFMAEANGLGVLFSGFFTMCARMNGKIKKLLGIKKEALVITLVIGYPAVKYKRTANRNKAVVKWM